MVSSSGSKSTILFNRTVGFSKSAIFPLVGNGWRHFFERRQKNAAAFGPETGLPAEMAGNPLPFNKVSSIAYFRINVFLMCSKKGEGIFRKCCLNQVVYFNV